MENIEMGNVERELFLIRCDSGTPPKIFGVTTNTTIGKQTVFGFVTNNYVTPFAVSSQEATGIEIS